MSSLCSLPNFCFVDQILMGINVIQGLVVSSRKESLQHFKQPWAHEHEPVKELFDAVKVWI